MTTNSWRAPTDNTQARQLDDSIGQADSQEVQALGTGMHRVERHNYQRCHRSGPVGWTGSRTGPGCESLRAEKESPHRKSSPKVQAMGWTLQDACHGTTILTGNLGVEALGDADVRLRGVEGSLGGGADDLSTQRL